MTEREMLEKAAKAMGLATHRYCEPWKAMYQYTMQDGFFGPRWNPLTDDGVALRLAVKLGIRIFGPGYAVTIEGRPFIEAMGDDEMANTRRAITRAAAAIGGAS